MYVVDRLPLDHSGNAASPSPGERKFAESPPSPASVEATGEKTASSPAGAEALAEAPVSTVLQVVSSPSSSHDGMLLSARRGGEGIGAGHGSVSTAATAKAEEGSVMESSPPTPRTEEASPAPSLLSSVAGATGYGGETMLGAATGRQTGGTAVAVATVGAAGGETNATIAAIMAGPSPADRPAEARMYVLPLGGLSAARAFPTYEAAMRSEVLVPCDSLDRSRTFVVFVSHRWVGGDPGGGVVDEGEKIRGGCSPDSGSAKHDLVVEGLSLILPSLPSWVAVYVWIDYCCVDQVCTQYVLRRFCGGKGGAGKRTRCIVITQSINGRTRPTPFQLGVSPQPT